MATASIPVDLFNPGQVFACLGFLEAADVLLGGAEGGFDWSDEGDVKFHLRAEGEENPFKTVLGFIAEADIRPLAPIGYIDKRDQVEEGDGEADSELEITAIAPADTFPAREGDRMALPVRFGGGDRPIIVLDHWADGSGREKFKLYSGNRSAYGIARAMLKGVRKKPNKRQKISGESGDLMIKGLAQLWEEDSVRLIECPFDILTPMGGSFNFDPRGAWTSIDAGYSPNDQKPKHLVEASPVVEFLAAWGLQHARPEISDEFLVRYATWGILLPPCLARVALTGRISCLPMRRLYFGLGSSGQNKIVTFAEQEPEL